MNLHNLRRLISENVNDFEEYINVLKWGIKYEQNLIFGPIKGVNHRM